MELEKQRFETVSRREEYLDGSFAEGARIGGRSIGRATLLPGHKWSRHVQPIVGTPSCEQGHVGYVVTGGFRVVMDDGREGEFGPGDLYSIPPGHDAEVVGDEPCVCVDIGAEA